MKVILKLDVFGLGRVGEIVNVKDGYARNFLIPKKLALYCTKLNIERLNKEKEIFQEENKKISEQANNIKKALLGKRIKIISQASDEGRLYGSITNMIIADKINNSFDLPQKIDKSNVSIKEPIKEVGIYTVNLSLHYDIKSEIEVVIGKSKEHISLLLEQKDGKKKKNKEENNNNQRKDKITSKEEENTKKTRE